MAQSQNIADVIIIGGGLHGCSTSLHLGLEGFKTIVIEKDRIGRHASSANAGGVRRLGRALPEIPLANAALESWHHISDLVGDDCGFRVTGQIKVAENEAELQALEERRNKLIDRGYQHEELIDQKHLRELLPAVTPHVLGGLIVHGDGYANPFQTVQAFRRKAIMSGARMVEHQPVVAISRHEDIWRIRTSNEMFESPIIVNCAGAWGGVIAAMMGDYAPVEPQALMLMITERVVPFIKPVVGAQGRSLSFKQFENGTVLIGGGYKGRADRDNNAEHLDFKGLAANAVSAAAIFPVMENVQVTRCWAGIEGVMPDGIPVIGKGSTTDAYHAFGFSAHGFAFAPIVGKILAQCILVDKTELSIAAFEIDRFKSNQQ